MNYNYVIIIHVRESDTIMRGRRATSNEIERLSHNVVVHANPP